MVHSESWTYKLCIQRMDSPVVEKINEIYPVPFISLRSPGRALFRIFVVNRPGESRIHHRIRIDCPVSIDETMREQE